MDASLTTVADFEHLLFSLHPDARLLDSVSIDYIENTRRWDPSTLENPNFTREDLAGPEPARSLCAQAQYLLSTAMVCSTISFSFPSLSHSF